MQHFTLVLIIISVSDVAIVVELIIDIVLEREDVPDSVNIELLLFAKDADVISMEEELFAVVVVVIVVSV